MKELEVNLKNRDKLIEAIEEQFLGPVLDFTGAQELSDSTSLSEKNNGFYFWKYAGKKEEVFIGDRPSKKYAAGILYPLLGSLKGESDIISDESDEMELDSIEETTEEKDDQGIPLEKRTRQTYLPSNLGLTFAVKKSTNKVYIQFSGGIYVKKLINPKLQKEHKEGEFWFRKSVNFEMEIDLEEGVKTDSQIKLIDGTGKVYDKISLRLDTVTRIQELKDTGEKVKLVTITITNVTDVTDLQDDECIVFQSRINVSNTDGFIPYPNASQLDADISNEDKKFDMLYRSELNYAFGQNCSTSWNQHSSDIYEISTTFIPEYEIKTMTPDIEVINEEGKKEKIEIPHLAVVASETKEDLNTLFNPLINGYELWFQSIKRENIPDYYRPVFEMNMKEIEKTINRIKKGLEIITSNEKVFDAFKLTNLAMFMQMVSGYEIRELLNDDGYLQFSKLYDNPFENIDFTTVDSITASIRENVAETNNHPWYSYKWRGFQIAFLLMTVESIYDKKSIERTDVDLIWFPTGGGKTEAYLALAAFSMLYRRVVNPMDTGVDIIMRYTLRLLTADQFQRATKLICSLEYIRYHLPSLLGDERYSIGLWVGQASTPNKNTGKNSAEVRLREYSENKTPNFPVDNCPWCNAEMTVLESGTYHGYTFTGGSLKLHCPDKDCHFNDELPIYFVDEDIYKVRPTFLIGTIDKFVQLTWVPEARSLFGIDKDGERISSPPNLIIQDELHLISGPLGTLTGIYETLIEWLCTDRRGDKPIVPKIVCATATIKAYKEQIHSLFGRGIDNANLFPPAGIDINDNFFSKVLMKEKDGEEILAPGRKYIGVYPFTQGRLQTEVQVISSLISKLSYIPDEERDPFWTILSFYNTINDIGKARTLTEQDIPNTINNYYFTRGIKNGRKINQDKVNELTSRKRSDEISKALRVMSEPYSHKNNEAIDIVLASNIIEVGVDIDRLSLMVINGQPKTSAQYIQVSGRVGRRTNERPGLVVTIYNPVSSNDKSHFEHFIEYHQKLYSQVEESSVTPFSHFAIERGLPAVLIGFLRQSFEQETLGKFPVPDLIEQYNNEINDFMRYLIKRAETIDNTEINLIREIAYQILEDLIDNDYDSWDYRVYGKKSNGFMAPMTQDQQDVPDEVRTIMFTMRSVDAISRLSVTKIFNGKHSNANDGVDHKEESGDKRVGRFNF